MNELLVLLFAAHTDLKPNYRRMAELSGGKYTYSSIEHRFRGLRARASELRDKTTGANSADGKVENGADMPGLVACGSNAKRKNGTAESAGDTPTKKARVSKKGTAKPIKRKAASDEDDEAKEKRIKEENDFVEED